VKQGTSPACKARADSLSQGRPEWQIAHINSCLEGTYRHYYKHLALDLITSPPTLGEHRREARLGSRSRRRALIPASPRGMEWAEVSLLGLPRLLPHDFHEEKLRPLHRYYSRLAVSRGLPDFTRLSPVFYRSGNDLG
jgi:hypothetical protein